MSEMSDPFILTFKLLVEKTSDCEMISVPKNQILMWDALNPFSDMTHHDVQTQNKKHWEQLLNSDNQTLTFKDWFKPDPEMIFKSTNSENATRFNEITMFGRKIILKSNPLLGHLHREFAIGSELNNINFRVPHFCTTLALFKHNNLFYLAMLKVEGDVLKTFLHDSRTTFADFINIYFQILLALEATQFTLEGFGHHDLHTENIILVQESKPRQFELYTRTFTHSSHLRPVIIDFGHASTNRVRIKKMEQYRMFSDPSPGFDAYYFVLYCIGESHPALKTTISTFANSFFNRLLQMNRGSNAPIKLSRNFIRNLHSGLERMSPAFIAEQLMGDANLRHLITSSFCDRETFSSTFNIPLAEYFIKTHYLEHNHFFIKCLRAQLFKKAFQEITDAEFTFEKQFFDKLDTSSVFVRLLKIELFFIIKRINLIKREPYKTIFGNFKPDGYPSVIREIAHLHQSRDFGSNHKISRQYWSS